MSIWIYKSIKKFKGQSSFSTWLYRITTNVCLDELRKRKKNINNISIDQEILLENGEVFRQIEDHENIPDLQAEKNELNRIIRNAIYDLSDEHKEVIVLRDIQGFSYNDIANIIKCPEGTVKSRINRSRKILKEALKSKMELWNEDYVK
jgi:RNA polymerase sigma-70 factor (ECF subfamily)